MLYKLKNYLFGWDYISWQNSAASGIARIHKDCNGTAWYFRYRSTRLVAKVTNVNQVIWLTCHPSKFLG